jgi:hypothetical protein
MSDESVQVEEKVEAVEPVVATISLTEEDIRAGIIESSGLYRARWLVALLLIGESVLLPALGIPFTSISSLLIGAVVFAAFTFLMPWRSARRQVGRLRAAGDTNVTYRFDAEGLTTRSAGASSTVAYRRLVKTKVGKKTLLLSFHDHVANIIPLRAFSGDELARVLAFLPPNAKAKKIATWRPILIWIALVFVFLVVWQFLSATSTPTTPQPAGDQSSSSR